MTQNLDLKPLDNILEAKTTTPSDLIPLLQQIQTAYGYLPQQVIAELSKRTNIPANKIFGVITFYEQFHLEPNGKHTIRCCRGTACHVKNGPKMIDAITEVLQIEPGQTTEDMKFTFETVACLGTCFLAPVMMINNDYYGHLNKNKIQSILESYS
ncbi:MAG: NADH-quinone oxidoreductase subunit NuoE [Planctomycetes bacterium]|nr:NADH-quinone oxidoreductase subunit NuoE [Planctomycetota bacterium]